jgi:hypothetical protein
MSADPRLTIVRNLLRIYEDVLQEPAPADLLELLERLEQGSGSR